MEVPMPDFGDTEVPVYLLLLPMCIFLLYIYGTYPYTFWKSRGLGGPKPTMFIGNIPELFGPETSKAAFAKWHATYGRVYGIYYFRYPTLVITKPELMKQVLVKDFKSYRERLAYDGSALLNREVVNGLFFAKGDEWRRIRDILTPFFSIAKIKSMTSIVNKSAHRLGEHVLKKAEEGEMWGAKLFFGAFAMDVVTGTGFGIDVDSMSNFEEPFTRHGRSLFIYKKSTKALTLLVSSFPALFYPIMKTLNIGFFKNEDMDFFDKNIRQMVNERKKESSDVKRNDFLQLLINAENENSQGVTTSGKLTMEEIVAQGIMLFLAGYETASSTLQFLIYELTQHPNAQEKIFAEIQSVMGYEEPTYDLCQNLKYTEAAINETLRMYPPLSILTRQTEKATTVSGLNLPAGTGIAFPLYTIGRDPEFWDNPDNFNPDRFLDGKTSAPYDPYTFIPFGIGPRICVGMKLGMLEMKLALVHILKRVKITDAIPKVLEINDFTSILQPTKPVKILAVPR